MDAIRRDDEISRDLGAVGERDGGGIAVHVGYPARGVQCGGVPGAVIGECSLLQRSVQVDAVEEEVFLVVFSSVVCYGLVDLLTACQWFRSASLGRLLNRTLVFLSWNLICVCGSALVCQRGEKARWCCWQVVVTDALVSGGTERLGVDAHAIEQSGAVRRAVHGGAYFAGQAGLLIDLGKRRGVSLLEGELSTPLQHTST